MRPRSFALVLACLIAPLAVAAQQPKGKKKEAAKPAAAPPAPVLDSLVIPTAFRARSIGPAVMGGRVAAIALDPTDPWTYYVGLGTGGIMKTTDDGATFKAIFEHEGVAAIGALAIAPSDHDVIWAGTGEANDRNSSSWGDGVYRSTDGGKTWTNVGLKGSKTIARIVVHPSDPRTAWVAATGDLWTPSAERGCYKTTDAGATWKLVLGAPAPYGDRVGCGDLALDPSNPDVLYAALYARRRYPWKFVSGADATDGKDLGGIWKSTDGGATWKKLSAGLPPRTQRIGLAVWAKDPKVVYAVVQSDAEGDSGIMDAESKAGGVFRSDDAGEHWTRMSRLDPRPFYFSQIRIDPSNDKRIYVLGFIVHVSEDGGKTWREDRFKDVHVDNHDLVIDPRSPKRLLVGNDGGLYQSVNGGENWEFQDRFAAGEFYRINVDQSTPYRICGGLQDNESWVGPSNTWSKDGIRNSDWTSLSGGDGSYCLFDAGDSNIVYAESQEGEIFRIDLRTAQRKVLKPEPTEGSATFRYHWSSPLIQSVHDKRVLYYGADRVFRLTNRGDAWQAISGDLSTGDLSKMTALGSGAETYGVVFALAESPVAQGLLYAGTDDGKLWKTENDGASWTDLTASLPPAVKGLWISRVEPSARDRLVAYVTIDGHRSGNYHPYILRTADGGKTWQNIGAGLPDGGPVQVVREDPKNPDLLFAGTEFGLWASVDRGAHWSRVGWLPTVAVDDILIHGRDLDLIAATHGRSLYVIDDIRPVEELTPEVQAKDVHLFSIRPAFGRHRFEGWKESAGAAVFRGPNPPEGALISWYLRRYTGDSVHVAVTNAAGQPVANFAAPGVAGIGRLAWDLHPTKDLLQRYGGQGAELLVPAGEYTVTLTFGTLKETGKVQVSIAPGVETR
ncbi:MAG: WD40/YVTN/BNR-like repeat-containing protein [Gemmatimonadota bacterium]